MKPPTIADERSALGRLAISGASPAGEDVRDSPEFDELAAAVRRMDSEGPNAVDWRNVASLSIEIIRSRSKDLLVGAWLAYALARTEGLRGTAIGLDIIRGMTVEHWDGLLPPAKRERARVAALDWLVGRLAPVIEALPAGAASADPAAALTAFDAVDEIDRTASERFTKESVSFVELIRLLRPLSREAGEVVAAEQRKAEEAFRQAEAAAAAAAAPAAPAAQPPPAAVAAPAPAAAPAAMPAPAGDANEAFGRLVEAMIQVARQLYAADRGDARAYVLNRVASYLRFPALPPSENGQIGVPAPLGLAQGIEEARAAGRVEEALDAAEAAIWDSPLWLDANRHAAEILEGLGPPRANARNAVGAGLAAFAVRLPEVLDLRFANGDALASPATRALIGSGNGGGGPDEVAKAAAQARAAAQAGDVPGGLGALVAAARCAASDRERLRIQLEQARYCLDYGLVAAALPLAEHLSRVVTDGDIERWEPELALAVAEVRARALTSTDAQYALAQDARQRALDETFARLARLDVGVVARTARN